MADTPQSISYIRTLDGVTHPLEASYLGGVAPEGYELVDNLVTTINQFSDDVHYPSAALMWEMVGDILSLVNDEPEEELFTLNSPNSTLDGGFVLG